MWAPPKADREAEQVLSDLSNDLMSPFCPGRTIAACPSGQARKLEERILAEAKSGKSRDEIEQALVADYGTGVIGYRPPPSLIATVVIGGVLALSVLIMLGRRWVRGTPATAAGPAGDAGKAAAAAGASGPSVAELDALEDALDDEDGF